MSLQLATEDARHRALPVVDTATVDELLAAAPDAVTVLFFRGDATRAAEAADIAVILPELIASFRGRLRAAVVAADSERALMQRFGLNVAPGLALARPDRTLGVIPKVQDWSDYLAQIRAMLAVEAPSDELEAQR